MNNTRPTIVLAALTLLISASPSFSADLDIEALKKGLPETVTPLTPDQLASKVPESYEFGEGPGKRVWKRIDADTWHEIYPDGFKAIFKVVGHTKIGEIEGTMVVKVAGDFEKTFTTNDGGLQAFIPDKGSKTMHHLYRNTTRGDVDWNDLAEMKEIK